MTRSGPSSAGTTTPTRPGSQQLTEQLNLDESLVTRYFDWLGGLLTGDLGTSIASLRPVSELIGANVVNTLVLVLLVGRGDDPGGLRHRDDLGQLPAPAPRHDHPDRAAGARRAAGVRHRHPAGRAVLDHGLPRPAGGDDRRRRRAPVGRAQVDDPAGGDPGAGGGAVRLPDRALHPARGARQRLRRAGPAQGHPRDRGDAQARAAQRGRAGHPGHRPPARLAGRRRGPGGDAVQLPRRRLPAGRLGHATTTCRWSRR